MLVIKHVQCFSLRTRLGVNCSKGVAGNETGPKLYSTKILHPQRHLELVFKMVRAVGIRKFYRHLIRWDMDDLFTVVYMLSKSGPMSLAAMVLK